MKNLTLNNQKNFHRVIAHLYIVRKHYTNALLVDQPIFVPINNTNKNNSLLAFVVWALTIFAGYTIKEQIYKTQQELNDKISKLEILLDEKTREKELLIKKVDYLMGKARDHVVNNAEQLSTNADLLEIHNDQVRFYILTTLGVIGVGAVAILLLKTFSISLPVSYFLPKWAVSGLQLLGLRNSSRTYCGKDPQLKYDLMTKVVNDNFIKELFIRKDSSSEWLTLDELLMSCKDSLTTVATNIPQQSLAVLAENPDYVSSTVAGAHFLAAAGGSGVVG